MTRHVGTQSPFVFEHRAYLGLAVRCAVLAAAVDAVEVGRTGTARLVSIVAARARARVAPSTEPQLLRGILGDSKRDWDVAGRSHRAKLARMWRDGGRDRAQRGRVVVELAGCGPLRGRVDSVVGGLRLRFRGLRRVHKGYRRCL